MMTALIVFSSIILCLITFVVVRWYLRFKRSAKYLTRTIAYWRENPTQMELGLATNEQVINELLKRPFPLILISPISGSNQNNGQINLHIANLHPEMATVLLAGASQLLRNSNLYGENPYENDFDD